MTKAGDVADFFDRHSARVRRIYKAYAARILQIGRDHGRESYGVRVLWYREAANTRDDQLLSARFDRNQELRALGYRDQSRPDEGAIEQLAPGGGSIDGAAEHGQAPADPV